MTDLQTLAVPAVVDRARELLAQMTLEEKLAQLVGFWEKGDGEVGRAAAGRVHARARASTRPRRHGLGHLTRVYGTRPVDAGRAGARGCGTSSAGWCARPGSASRRSCTRSA